MSLPEGWETVQLKEICQLINGRAYKQEELLDRGKYPVLRVGNFFSNRGWYYSDLELEEDKYCDNGDLLYAWSASFGPRIWSGGKVIFHYHIWKTRHEPKLVERGFLCRWFEWDTKNVKAEHGTGTTMIHVTKADMEERQLSLPPLAEQRRIVDKLDVLTARLARARADLERFAHLAPRLRGAALAEHIDGAATRTVILGDVLEDIRYGTAKKCDYDGGSVPVLRIPNVQRGRIDTSDLKFADFDQSELRKLSLRQGDVLVIRSNGSRDLVGKSAVVEEAAIGMLYAGYLIRLRPDLSQLLPEYLQIFLASPATRQLIENMARSSSGVNNINAEQLKALRLPLPTIEEQSRIVASIKSVLARADRLEAEAARAHALLDRLEAAILAKAFRGELVPQDQTDEPASVLLDHIRTQRAAAPAAKRGRRPALAPA